MPDMSDLSANLPAKLQPFLVRMAVIKAVRAFFDQQHFQEVITPVFNRALPLEPDLYPFQTVWQTAAGQQTFYLPISPEANLKKLLAAGVGNCYSIGHTFRNLESAGPQHRPEFLMLEWYREAAEFDQIMADTQQLVAFVAQQLAAQDLLALPTADLAKLAQPWPVLSLARLFTKYCQLDLAALCADEPLLVEAARQRGYQTSGSTWKQLFEQLFVNEIEPRLPTDRPFLVVDFPAKISPLCQVQARQPHLAARFEGYLGGMELVNGNTERTDSAAVQAAFSQEAASRRQAQQPVPPIDQELVTALAKMDVRAQQFIQHHNFAGAGLGVERLAMVMGGIKKIEMLNGM